MPIQDEGILLAGDDTMILSKRNYLYQTPA